MADVVTVNIDVGGFHWNTLLGAMLHFVHIETDGVDTVGNELHTP